MITRLTLMWLAMAGVWPWADPRHDFTTVVGTFDIIVHWAATTTLLIIYIEKWRQQRHTTETQT